ncbi:MAG: hypothetical protein JOZ31_24820 [Verrucomicrobia bacterium]|nr:hypothetical protein [Verrucomicrobiota bacterium]MBV8484535.1 hypothetical protein [Verrucomicrobiota bacterium]
MIEILEFLAKVAGHNPFCLLVIVILAVVLVLGKALLHVLEATPPFVRIVILVIIVAGFVGFLILQGSIVNGGFHVLTGSE